MSEEYALAGNHTGLLRVIWHMKNSRSSLKAVHQGNREGLEAIEQEIRSGCVEGPKTPQHILLCYTVLLLRARLLPLRALIQGEVS